MIKTWLEGAKGIWLDKLPSVLWAYKTTARTLTRETSFRLTFGSEAIIPTEVGIASYRIAYHDEGKNEEGIHLHLDLLDEVRVAIEQRMTRYQYLMAKYYNAKVKPRHFSIGDLVLRKVTMTTKVPTQEKLRPNWEGLYHITSVAGIGTYYLEDLDKNVVPHP